MTKSILVASLSALALAGAAPAVAQSSNSQASGNNANTSDPRSLTCAQLSAYDTATVPGVLYFLSGVRAGERMNSTGAGASSSSADKPLQSADAQSNDAMASDDAMKADDAMQSADAGSAASGDQNANSGNAQDPALEIGRLSGYFTIPVQQLLVACDTDPSRNVAELLDEQSRNMANSGTDDEMTGSIGANVGEPSNVDEILPMVYGQNAPDLSGLNADNARIVGISSISSNNDYTTLDQTISERSPDALLAEINGNDALTSKLEEQGYAADDVLAVSRREGGEFVVYVDDRNS